MASVKILARLEELRREAAAEIRLIVDSLIARGRNAAELTFDDSASEYAPCVHGIRVSRIGRRVSTICFYGPDDNAASEHILSPMDTFDALRALETVSRLVNEGVLAVDEGVVKLLNEDDQPQLRHN